MYVMVPSDELMHYGVLGMKWGVRHDRKKSGNSRHSGSKAEATAKGKKSISESRGSHSSSHDVGLVRATSKEVNKAVSALEYRQIFREGKKFVKSPYFGEVKGAKKLFSIDESTGKGDVFEYDQKPGSMGQRAKKAVTKALSGEKDGSTGTLYADARDWTIPIKWIKRNGKVSFSDAETGASISDNVLFSDRMVSTNPDWYYTNSPVDYGGVDYKLDKLGAEHSGLSDTIVGSLTAMLHSAL